MPLDEPQPLRQSLRGLSWARLITAAMVVVAGAVLRYAGSFPFQFLPFTLAVSAAALVSCLLLVGSVHGADLRRFAWMQVCLDVALVTGIIAASGGSDSVFSFLYVLTVLEGSYLLGRIGGLVAASLAGLLYVDAGGSRFPASAETVAAGRHSIVMNGREVFKFAVRKTEEIARRVLDRNGIGPGDLDLFVSHQANRRIILSATEKLGIDPDKVIINIERFGNTTAATIPLALNDAVCSGRLKKGDLVLLASVGAGFTVGAVLLRWGF